MRSVAVSLQHEWRKSLTLFSPWIPLVFEALVLFVRERTNKRAAWLGFALLYEWPNCHLTWFNFILIPFALYIRNTVDQAISFGVIETSGSGAQCPCS
jgi:hypothetical protein